MKTQSVSKPIKSISQGRCVFCEAEVVKSKMTQHLKFCKPRLAIIAQERQSEQPKMRWLHILAEGRNNPQYWIHFEVPDDGPLWLLDRAIKEMWIDNPEDLEDLDNLDNLICFTINGQRYIEEDVEDEYPEGPFILEEEIDEEDEEEEDEEEEDEEEEEEEELSEEDRAKALKELIDEIFEAHAETIQLHPKMLPAEWIAEIKKPRSVEDCEDFLKQERVRLDAAKNAAFKSYSEQPKSVRDADDEKLEIAHALYLQENIVRMLLAVVEDVSVDVPLKRVLKVGQKFSYTCGDWLPTDINLRVIAEREGAIREGLVDVADDGSIPVPIQLLARNIAPEFSCLACGKPATNISMDDGSVLCDNCLKKQEYDEEQFIPIINSPWVGVL